MSDFGGAKDLEKARFSRQNSLKTPTHNRRLPISSSTGQHFVDSDDMEWMKPHPDMELIFAAVLHQVLVAANTSGFKSLRRKLLQFIRDEMNTQREIVYWGLLLAQVKNTDLGVWDTTAEPGLGVGLVFAVAVTETIGQKC